MTSPDNTVHLWNASAVAAGAGAPYGCLRTPAGTLITYVLPVDGGLAVGTCAELVALYTAAEVAAGAGVPPPEAAGLRTNGCVSQLMVLRGGGLATAVGARTSDSWALQLYNSSALAAGSGGAPYARLGQNWWAEVIAASQLPNGAVALASHSVVYNGVALFRSHA